MDTEYTLTKHHPELCVNEDDHSMVKQFAYYTYILFYALRLRERKKLPKLNININYLG